jgi:hypothetical protein
MNWEIIGVISEAAGAVAVILTLFYLARQIRHSIQQGRRIEIGATLQQFSIARMAVTKDRELADIFLRGSTSYESLDPLEQLRFGYLMSQRLWVWHSIWDGVQTNAFESYFWTVSEHLISDLFRQPGIKEWWELKKFEFPTQYIEEIDSFIINEA